SKRDWSSDVCSSDLKSTHQNQTHECLYRYAVHTSSPTRRLHHQNQPATRHYRRSWSQPSQVDRSNHYLQPCSTPFGRARVMGWWGRGGKGQEIGRASCRERG